MKLIKTITGDHADLLERFLATRDPDAFSKLAGAHLPLVYSAALRITRAPDLAEEVAQTVLIKLASLTRPLAPGVPLSVWLHRVTRSAAIDLVRAESRRRNRETAAAALADESCGGVGAGFPWDQISPVIDEVIGQLPARDRDLIFSRFFTGSSHAAMARTLGLSEDAVRMRLKRAMEKMRALLQRRGIATSASLLALCLPAQASSPVPPILQANLPPVVVPPPPRFFVWLRSLSLPRLMSPFQGAALAAWVLVGTYSGPGPQVADAVASTVMETPPAAAPMLPPEGVADPTQDPGFEQETASRFKLSPGSLPAPPPDDPDCIFPERQIEVVFKIDLTAPGRFSA